MSIREGSTLRCGHCGKLSPEGASFCSQCGTLLTSTQQPPSTSGGRGEAQAGVVAPAWVPSSNELASLGQRAGSWIIDWVLQAIPYLGLIPAIINGVLYRRGTTIGLSIVSARIIRENGDISGFYHTAVRAMAAFLSIIPFGLGYWWAFWDPMRQTWHDKIMHTYVLRNTPELERRRATSSKGALVWFWLLLGASLLVVALVFALVLRVMVGSLGTGLF